MEKSERALVQIHNALEHLEGIRHTHFVQCPEWHLNCCLTTSSIKKVYHLMKLLEEAPHLLYSEIANSNGVMIKPKNNSYQQAFDVVWTYLRHHLSDLDTTHAPFVLYHKGCIFKRYYYSVGDDIVVENDDVIGTPYKKKIREILGMTTTCT